MFPRMTSDLQARQAVRQERKVSQEVEDDSGAGRPLRFHIKININHIIFMFMTTIMIRSPDEKQASLHLSRERSLKSISNWWRSSLEGDLFIITFIFIIIITSLFIILTILHRRSNPAKLPNGLLDGTRVNDKSSTQPQPQ